MTMAAVARPRIAAGFPVMAGAGAAVVERAHDIYRGGRHRGALELYSAALAASPPPSPEP
jgi:hypothetical protein